MLSLLPGKNLKEEKPRALYSTFPVECKQKSKAIENGKTLGKRRNLAP